MSRDPADDLVVVAHWSGHWSLDEDGGIHWRPVDQRLVKRFVKRFVNTERRHGTDLEGWESWVPARDEQLRKKHGGDANGAECPISHDTSEWTSLARGAEQVTKLGVKRRGGDVRPGVWLTWELFQHRNGWTDLCMGQHNASGVQRGKKWRGGRLGAWAQGKVEGSRRVRVWVAAAIGTRRVRRRLVKKYHPDEQNLSLDGNLDITKRRWFIVVQAAYGGVRLRLLRLPRGTKRKRGIDVMLTTMRGKKVVVVDPFGRLDHAGLIAVLRPRARTLRNSKRLHTHQMQDMASPTTRETA